MIFLQLVRLGLGLERTGDAVINLSERGWLEVYQQLRNQALVGIGFAGLERLTKDCTLPKGLLLKWLGIVESIRRRNEVMDDAAVSLCKKLDGDGWKFCILKGQSVAQLYPKPSLRQSGDIDIWIYGHNDGRKVSRRSIIRYLERGGRKVKLCYLHADGITIKGDVAVEVHFKPSFSVCPWKNVRLQKELTRLASEDDFPVTDSLSLPAATYAFNRLFMLHHIYRHLFSEGIGMRQVVDYAMLLMQRTDSIDYSFENTLKHLGMLHFAQGLMWILKSQLNVPKEHLYTCCDEKEGQFLLDEILRSGNFGAASDIPGNKSRWGRFKKKACRNLSFLTKYPLEVLWYVPFSIWETLRYKIPHR